MASILDLPPELFLHIVSLIPIEDTQSSILALTRAAPYAPIPLHYLFEHIRIVKPAQAVKLYQRIRRFPSDASGSPRTWVKTISIESFEVDADICINLLRTLERVERLTLHVGPKNFNPEHLEELFDKPMLGLQHLALRFRPYLQKVNHYQFLKGAYYDSVLNALAKWPDGCIPVMSIVQDTLDPQFVPRHFAQPMVFFQLDPPLPNLVRSDALSELTSFRLRIPSRPVVRSLVNGPTLPTGPVVPAAAHRMTFLDLSTCNVLENEVDQLLMSFHNVRHLVLDSCAILKGELREGEWANLGKRCALVGIRRAREKEKSLKTMLELRYAQAGGAAGDGNARNQRQQQKKAKRGRRGVATATISLREEQAPTSAAAGLIPANIPKGAITKIRVLPPAPSLRSFCTTTTASSSTVAFLNLHPPPLPGADNDAGTANPATLSNHLELKHAFIRAEFAKGWEEGLSQLRNHRKRLKDSWNNSTARVMRFCGPDEEENHDAEYLVDLCDIEKKEGEEVFGKLEGEEEFKDSGGILPCPIICLAGPDRAANHVAGCGHSIGQNIWDTYM